MQTDTQRRKPLFSCLLRAIFLLIGVPSLLLATIGYTALSGGGNFSNNRVATGTLIEEKDAPTSCPYFVVAFTADDGQRVTFEGQDCSGAQVGQNVQIMYDPHNPTLMPTIVNLGQSARYRVAGYAIAGLAFTLLGLVPFRGKSKAAPSSAMT